MKLFKKMDLGFVADAFTSTPPLYIFCVITLRSVIKQKLAKYSYIHSSSIPNQIIG